MAAGRLIMAALVASAAVACAHVGPQTAQLEQFKRARMTRDYAAIRARPLACTGHDDHCRQLHLIRGDACFRLAKAHVAAAGPKLVPDPAAVAHDDCAIAHLALGVGPQPAAASGLGPVQPFAEELLEALRERQDLSRSRAEGRAYGAALVVQAKAYRAAFPEKAAGAYYLAAGRLAQSLPRTPERCAGLESVLETLADAPAPQGRYAAAYREIERSVARDHAVECGS